MKIEYRKGDLLSTDIPVILHGCNAQGVMGSGVALAIRTTYPLAYKRYIERHRQHPWELGEIQVIPCGNKVIINAITQEYYGKDRRRYVDYNAVKDVMRKVNGIYDVYGYKQLAMPKIGAGLGGGDWAFIETIIESELIDVQPVVYEL